MEDTLADMVRKYKERVGSSFMNIERLSNGMLSSRTVYSWARGDVKKPREWQALIQFVLALNLSEDEANEVLTAGGHKTIGELQQTAINAADSKLLARWEKRTIVFQAPRIEAVFVGREMEKERIKDALLRDERICIIVGMGGVGKSTLATRIAHEIRTTFPDGILWAQVGGEESITSILTSFANAYGHNISHHETAAQRTEDVRRLLAAKRCLVVLDNVTTAQELAALMPSKCLCSVLVTTRNRRSFEQVAAEQVELLPLTQSDGYQLLIGVLGQQRVDQEIDAAKRLIWCVEGLPLALRLTTGILKSVKFLSLSELSTQLEDEKRRLDHLESWAEAGSGIRASFELSYRLLPAETQKLFVSLSIFHAQHFSVAAVAAINALELIHTKMQMGILADFSLINPHILEQHDLEAMHRERYQLHTLLRLFAQTKRADVSLYFQRGVGYYKNVVNLLNLPVIDLEWENIVGLLAQAIEVGQVQEMEHIVAALSTIGLGNMGYLDARGHWREGYDWTDFLLERSEGAADPFQRAQLMLKKGVYAQRLGEHDIAEGVLQNGYDILNSLSA